MNKYRLVSKKADAGDVQQAQEHPFVPAPSPLESLNAVGAAVGKINGTRPGTLNGPVAGPFGPLTPLERRKEEIKAQIADDVSAMSKLQNWYKSSPRFQQFAPYGAAGGLLGAILGGAAKRNFSGTLIGAALGTGAGIGGKYLYDRYGEQLGKTVSNYLNRKTASADTPDMNRAHYFMSKVASAEKTMADAISHAAPAPTKPVEKTLGESDDLMYGKGEEGADNKVKKEAADVNTPSLESQQPDGEGRGKGAIGDYYSRGLGFVIPPIIGPITNALGRTVGALSDASPQSDKYFASSLLPGVASYRMAQRRRQVDRERSGGSRDRSALIHETIGSIMQPLLFTLLGAGALGGFAHLQGAHSSDVARLALKGGLMGLGTSGIIHLYNTYRGAGSANQADREKYLKDSPMWKNYLIPGYAAYQAAAGDQDVLHNT